MGITKFAPETKGTKYNAKIQSIEADSFDPNTKILSIELNLPKTSIKQVTFYDNAGNKIDVLQKGYMAVEGLGTTLMFAIPPNFPATGRISVDVFAKSERKTVPFVISNFDFLGRPLGENRTTKP